jgi:SAM-dependent methyltransferase
MTPAALPSVLDPCCGARSFYFDRRDPRVVFGDIRSERLTVTDRTRGNTDGTRTLVIEPEVRLDFRALPYPDSTFFLVVFDPPHLVRAGRRSYLAARYGQLGPDWREDIRRGFSECFRVLKPGGTLVFKWSETQIPLSGVLSLTPRVPIVGNKKPKTAGAHWLVFINDW